MTTRKLVILTISLFCAILFTANAQTSIINKAESRRQTADKLRAQLAHIKTTEDSIAILYDIFDLLPRKEQPEVGREIYNIAKRIGNDEIRLDICRLLTGCFNGDKFLVEIEKEVQKIPTSKEQKETQLFLRLKRISATSKDKPENEKQKAIIRILSEESAGKDKNPYQKLTDLYTLVEYLRNDEPGELLQIYTDKLVKLATSEHFELYAIPNIIYTKVASVYSDAEDGDKSVAADRNLLKIIDDLEKSYEKEGRHYRDFEITRYTVYRRMLRNHQWLKPGEAEELYQKSLKLAEASTDVKNDIEKKPRFKAYYNMASGHYAEAIPYLKELLETQISLPLRKQVLEFLVEASDKAGDTGTKLQALTDLVNTLSELNKIKSAQRYRELDIVNDVQNLKQRNAQLKIENQEEAVLSAKRIMGFVCVGFILLLITFAFSLNQWGRFKRNAHKMGEVVDRINEERRRMGNSLYYDYDKMLDPLFTEENHIGWHERLKKIGGKNDDASSFMTRSIINDLMFIAATGHSARTKYIGDLSVDYILSHVRDQRKEKHIEGEHVVFEMPKEDFTIKSDFECLTGLIGHIIDTGLEYSPEHSVEVSCEHGPEGYVDFIITTHGIQNGASSEDPQIFDNFMTIHRILTRPESGLFICRMISFLLKCVMIPMPDYKNGARYVMRVPADLTCE